MHRLLTVAALAACSATPALGQGRNVKIETTDLGGGVHMLVGQGGNIGVCVGEDGVFMIDDQFAPLTPLILQAVGGLSEEPIKFVINTHWHGDHTGGNENLGELGALIVAHENVRKRMTEEQFLEAFGQRVPPAPEAALPVITFTESMTFHWNDEKIDVVHLAPAHTDGDSFIQFHEANVVHMGDTFFNGMYPFIDVSTGGSIGGMIAAVDTVLDVIDDDTKIIPGHGPLATPDDLRTYREMLVTAQDRITKLKADGKSRDEAIAAKPTADLDEKWGGGFMQPDVWVGIVYDGI